MSKLRYLIASLLLLGALAAPAGAAPPQSRALTPPERADVQRIEQYLNGIHTLTARFQQFAQDGGTAGGKLFLARPGHMRFEYDPPSPILLVADGMFVVYIDNKLKEITYLPISSTPAWFLLRDKVSLEDGVTITRFEHNAGAIRVSLVENKSPENGTLTLVFSDQPLELKQWSIVDQQGRNTVVSLSDPHYGVTIDPQAFTYVDPRTKRHDMR